MTEPLRCTAPKSLIAGWDFSTGGVKCLIFDLKGKVVAETRLPTDLWQGSPVEEGLSELNIMQLEGQARASVRAIAAQLRRKKRLGNWVAGGISATHHTAGRIDANQVQVRRAICWNDHTLGKYHAQGLRRLGGQKKVEKLIGGPWAIRYSLSHLVKDEQSLSEEDWKRTARILPHGALSAGFLTGNFDVCSVSVAASTGMLDFRKRKWAKGMLDALKDPAHRRQAWKQLPKIIADDEPVGLLSENLALEAGIEMDSRPVVFPTSDDQQAGLIGGGAVDDGQVAIILGNSAVVNSSSNSVPSRGNLDVMCLNWGPYLWMRCYNNGAQFLDQIVGQNPDWAKLEAGARKAGPCPKGAVLMPFIAPEPSLNVKKPNLTWIGTRPKNPGVQFRASLEALAYMIALGVKQHERAGQKITRVSVSGGIAKSDLMCEILATVLGRPLERLVSDEGPALGAAVTALAAYESNLRREQGIKESFTVADAVNVLVKYRDRVEPNAAWQESYAQGLKKFQKQIK